MKYSEFTIKKKNGSERKICAPDKPLYKFQKFKLKGLYKLLDKELNKYNLQNVFHGFIKGKNSVSAATEHIGYEYTVMMDIKDFFDSVNKSMLEKLYTNYKFDDSLFHKDGRTAQGFVTSPCLANLAIIPCIRNILHKIHDCKLTIYADDIQISTNDKSYIKDIIKIVTNELTASGFKVNKNKTRIKSLQQGYKRILGVNVGKDHIRATRKTMRKIRAARHQSNKYSLGGLVNWSKCNLPNSYKKE